MSFNNFSYFNGPATNTQWWAPNSTSKPGFEEPRILTIPNQPISNAWSKSLMTSEYNNQTFSQPVQGMAQSMILPSENQPAEPSPSHHEVMQGTVTQLFANFGYINDTIIFSKTDVLGQMVKVGDKVAVDATYQPNNPTKYKGERVYKIDEARFNSVVNSNSGKMKTLSHGSSSRIEIPVKGRHRDKFNSREISPRTDSSIKSRLDYKYNSRDLSPRGETSIKSRLDYNYDNREPSPRVESSIKNRLDYKHDNRDTSPRVESSKKTRLDYKYDIRDVSPSSRSSSKNRYDHKYERQRSSPRPEGSSKSRLEYQYEKPKRFLENQSSYKRSLARKEKLKIDNKARNEAKARIDARRQEFIAKAEATKRKAISPIKFQISTRDSSSGKRKSESKPLSSKAYENFACRELDCAALKNLYRSLTLPKEIFHISLKYQNSFPLNHPMKLGNNCHFKIMDKKVKSIDPFIDIQLKQEVDPEDADTTFVAKVMLMSTDDLAKFYKDTLTLAEEFDGDNKVPITKAIKFLVGSVGQNQEFAIGGAWSPSLDGADPETNPRVLINTAIRTCKAMTGVDLSNCSSWPKFLELHYYRPLQQLPKKNTKINENSSAEEPIDVDALVEPTEYKEPRMETVVYYIPDVWNCVPSLESWNETKRLYQEQLTSIMCPPPDPMVQKSASGATSSSTQATAIASADTSVSTTTNGTNIIKSMVTSEDEKIADGGDQDEEDWNFIETEDVDKAKNSEAATADTEELPTHFSKLVVAGMKIVDIKKELDLRKLNSRGVMEQLKARLKSALDREELEEKNKDSPVAVVPVQVVIKETPKSTLSEEQKTELKKLYTLPDRPEVIVHQNHTIFGNKMKLRAMSLHSLLSYHNVTLQENTFELAIFAKQFLDMLRRDAVFNIYKSIVVADEADLNNIEDSAKKPKLMVTVSKRTVNRPLLFSCSLLDREKANKISTEDLKTLIEGLGICLSSDQLSSVLTKVKDSGRYFNYRQLTDKEMTDSDIASLLNSDVSEDLDYIKELAVGNKALFESEAGVLDTSMNDDEMERLKNELDKSERCRQATELKVAEMKDETERNIKLVQVYVKEMNKLKEQAAEYRLKYHSEQDRSEFYKHDFERLLRYMRDVDKMTGNLNKFVGESLQKYDIEGKKTAKEDSVKTDEPRVRSEDEEKMLDIAEEENHVSIEASADCEMTEAPEQQPIVIEDPTPESKAETGKEAEPQAKAAVVAIHSSVEDFDLAKPSDYDMIIIDETE